MEEVADGRFGLRLISWMFGVGIVCFLPMTESVSSCPDPAGVDIPCPLNTLPGVNCTYSKGLPPQLPELPPGSIEYPGRVVNLDVKTVVRYDNQNSCGTYLNITWSINPFANQRNLRGFLLNITFFYVGADRNIIRTYNLSVADWNNKDIYKTAFRHECVEPAADTKYRIEIHSLPLSTLTEKNFVEYYYTTSSSFYSTAPCDHPNDTDMTYRWRATMWAKQSPSEDTYNTLEICFFLAPVEFRFGVYKVSLLNMTSSTFLITVAETFVYNNGSKDRQVCEKFTNICPGVYKAWVTPVNQPWCVCRAGPSPDGCRDSCYATELSPIDMGTSVCSTSQTTTPTAVSASSLTPLLYDDSGNGNAGKIAGIVIGIIVALAVVVVIIILYIRRHRQHDLMKCPPRPPDKGSEVSVSQQSVLLIYSTDNDSHRKVVRSFAAFLHARCGCDVLYDEWSQVDIAQTNPIDWLTKQMYHVKHVIVVNSLGAHEQHRGWIEQKQYVPVSNLLLPDIFIPAIRLIQNKVYLGSPQFHCFHVCFPYTEQKHVLDLSFGRCYKLMDHMEDLFLHIHGMTKFNAKGTTFANQINATSYNIHAKEGRALHDAIQEACEYTRDNSDWFHKHYRHQGTSLDGNKAILRNGSFLYERLSDDASTHPSSVKSNGGKDEAKTSDLGNASDMDYIPPSADGSYNGDVEIHSVSPDFGIGGMNDDSIFEASSPPMFMQFTPLPPDDFDDASSIGSRSFVAKVHELNEQFDSGFPSSLLDFRTSRSDC